MTWIIGRGGLILYTAAWTDPADVEHALAASLEALPRRASDQPRGLKREITHPARQIGLDLRPGRVGLKQQLPGRRLARLEQPDR